jgi:hypothetical protein
MELREYENYWASIFTTLVQIEFWLHIQTRANLVLGTTTLGG